MQTICVQMDPHACAGEMSRAPSDAAEELAAFALSPAPRQGHEHDSTRTHGKSARPQPRAARFDIARGAIGYGAQSEGHAMLRPALEAARQGIHRQGNGEARRAHLSQLCHEHFVFPLSSHQAFHRHDLHSDSVATIRLPDAMPRGKAASEMAGWRCVSPLPWIHSARRPGHTLLEL